MVMQEGDEMATTKKAAAKTNAKRDATLARIAWKHLDLATLETLNSDRFDFSNQSVWSIRAALEAAYKAGQEAK